MLDLLICLHPKCPSEFITYIIFLFQDTHFKTAPLEKNASIFYFQILQLLVHQIKQGLFQGQCCDVVAQTSWLPVSEAQRDQGSSPSHHSLTARVGAPIS